MEFLEGTKRILQYLDVYTRPPVNFGFIKIPSNLIEFFAFVSMTTTTIPLGAYCFVKFVNFRVTLAGWLHFIANSSIKIIYLTLLAKRKIIISSIDHLETLIKNSKIDLILDHWIIAVLINLTVTLFHKGIRLHLEMMDVHNNRDQQNNRLAQNLLRSGIYTILSFYLPNAIPPLKHLLFGWPENFNRNFPFPVVYVRSKRLP